MSLFLFTVISRLMSAAAKEAEFKIKEELRHQAERIEREFQAREADLQQTVQELRSAVLRQQERQSWREEEFKKEIQVLAREHTNDCDYCRGGWHG